MKKEKRLSEFMHLGLLSRLGLLSFSGLVKSLIYVIPYFVLISSCDDEDVQYAGQWENPGGCHNYGYTVIDGECKCLEEEGYFELASGMACKEAHEGLYYSNGDFDCPCVHSYFSAAIEDGSWAGNVWNEHGVGVDGGLFGAVTVGGSPDSGQTPSDSITLFAMARGVMPSMFRQVGAPTHLDCFYDRGSGVRRVDLGAKVHEGEFMVVYLEYEFEDFTRESCSDTLWHYAN